MERIIMILLWAAACSLIVTGCLLVIAATWKRCNSQGWRFIRGTFWLVCVASWSVWITAGQHPPVFERNIALKIVWKILPLVGGTALFLVVRRLVRKQPGTSQGE